MAIFFLRCFSCRWYPKEELRMFQWLLEMDVLHW